MLRTLYEGICGRDVIAVQEALNLYSLGLPPLETHSGIFGPKTKEAVIAFQTLKGLKPDGIVGHDTRAALFPFGAGHMRLVVTQSKTPVTQNRQTQVGAVPHPVNPVTTGHFPGLSTPLGVPAVPPANVPATTGSNSSTTMQVKAGQQISVPLSQTPPSKTPAQTTGAVVIDWIPMILTPRKVDLGPASGKGAVGIDLGLSLPNLNSNKFSATAQWAVTLAPDCFKHGRWDLLSFSAKAGAGLTSQSGVPIFLTGNASLALAMSYTLIPGKNGPLLDIFLQGGFSAVVDHHDSKWHLSTTLPGVLGLKGSF